MYSLEKKNTNANVTFTTTPLYAAMQIANRAEAVRLAVHLLSGGDVNNLPETWKSESHVWPPGPAAEYGNCLQGIAKAAQGHLDEGMQVHAFMGKESDVGLCVVPTRSKGGKPKYNLRVPDVLDIMLAGVPAMTVMLARVPSVIRLVVRAFK